MRSKPFISLFYNRDLYGNEISTDWLLEFKNKEGKRHRIKNLAYLYLKSSWFGYSYNGNWVSEEDGKFFAAGNLQDPISGRYLMMMIPFTWPEHP